MITDLTYFPSLNFINKLFFFSHEIVKGFKQMLYGWVLDKFG